MSDDRAFRDKWRARIDGCDAWSGCLLIVIILAIAFLAFVIR
jgi:hypothetical protein